MVTLVLIGIIVTFAVLSIDTGSGREVEREARRLVALVDLAEEEAVMQSREMGILFEEGGYRFFTLGGDNAWQPYSDDLLRPRALTPGMTLQLYLEGLPVALDQASSEPTPQVFLLSSGERSPFEVVVGVAEEGIRYKLTAPPVGDLTLTGPLQ